MKNKAIASGLNPGRTKQLHLVSIQEEHSSVPWTILWLLNGSHDHISSNGSNLAMMTITATGSSIDSLESIGSQVSGHYR